MAEFPAIDGVDIARGMSSVGANPAVYRRLLGRFSDEHGDDEYERAHDAATVAPPFIWANARQRTASGRAMRHCGACLEAALGVAARTN